MPQENSPKACVVVPLYRPTLAPYEQLALNRCLEVLKQHDIVVIKPRSLAQSHWSHSGIIAFESFPDEFFESVATYNALMLSDDLYARFASYDFILIHQLDALVFRDELLDWCRAGYDYVGAPWLPNSRVPSRLKDLRMILRRKRYRWVDRRYGATNGLHRWQYMYSAGNGGFSLRRVATMRDVLARLAAQAAHYVQENINEDLFFAVEANRYRTRVRVPRYRKAAEFSWESEPAVCGALTRGKLPFGCHGWNKLHRDEWRPIFQHLGYSLDALLDSHS